MDPRSELTLNGVHPDLAKVMRHAPQIQPFIVIHGLRTLAEEKVYVAKGDSTTLHSRHLPNLAGFACAVDVACLVDGHVNWNTPAFIALSKIIKSVAKELDIPVEWGGDWHDLKDFGHYQLPWHDYP